MAQLKDEELENVNGGIIDYILSWDEKYKYLDPVIVINQPDFGVGYVQDFFEVGGIKMYVVFFPDAKGGATSLRIPENMLRPA